MYVWKKDADGKITYVEIVQTRFVITVIER